MTSPANRIRIEKEFVPIAEIPRQKRLFGTAPNVMYAVAATYFLKTQSFF